jgi:hypothetical protein
LRELPELRAADSDTFLQSDGSRALKIYAHPVNYRAADGSWMPIDDALAEHPNRTWTPVASPVPVAFPPSLAEGPMTIGSESVGLGLSLQGASAAEGRTVGPRRIYAGALPGVTASYTVSPSGIRELLTLASASAPSVYRYDLTLGPGLHAMLTPAGDVVIRDPSGRIAYTLAAPSISDSSSTAARPQTAPVHYLLNPTGSVLSVVLDKRWLDDPKRVFPVKIDPDEYFAEAQDCTITSERDATKSLCGGPLYVGADAEKPKDVSRALLHFDLSSIPRNATILRSRLALWFEADSTESPIDIEAHALTRGFTESATWDTYNGSSSWSTAGADYATATAGETTLYDEYKEWWVNWGFTPTVEQWVREPSSNYGILLKANKETTSGYDTFVSAGHSGEEPDLEVYYEPRMGNPANQLVVSREAANETMIGVNVANGNLTVSQPDFDFEGEGYASMWSRSYNSQDDGLVEHSFGNWQLNMGSDTALSRTWWDGSYSLRQGDGSYTRFDRAPSADEHPSSGDLAFTSEAGLPATLVKHEDGTRTLTYNDTGVEWKFDNKSETSLPQKIVDPRGEGNTISLSYSGSSLTSLSDTHGHTLGLTWDKTGSHVMKISEKPGEIWEYSYNKTGQLTACQGPEGRGEAKYGYYKDGMLKDIVDPTGTYVAEYDGSERATSVRRVVNGSLEKIGSEDEITSLKYGEGSTNVTEPDGSEDTYYYNSAGEALDNPGTEEAAAEFYSDSAGVGLKEAAADVELQNRAAPLDSQLYQQLGDEYVGEWFDSSTGHVKLGISSGAPEQEVVQDIQDLGLTSQTEIVKESASWGQLTKAQSTLDSSLETLEKEGLVTTGIDSSADAVTIREAKALGSEGKSTVKSDAGKAGAPTNILEEEAASMYAQADGCEHTVCSAPLRGGVHIEHDGEKPLEYDSCTAGFIARSIYSKRPYILTAGHCLWSVGLESKWSSAKPDDREVLLGHEYYTFSGRAIGSAQSYVYGEHHSSAASSEGDAGLISITGSHWEGSLLPIIAYYGHDDQYSIIGTHYNPKSRRQGFVLCTSGASEIPIKGELYNPIFEEHPVATALCGITGERVNQRYSSKGGSKLQANVKELVELKVCNKKMTKGIADGDSGAPVFRDHFAYGIISGTTLDGCRVLFEGVNNAEYALQVHVATIPMTLSSLI